MNFGREWSVKSDFVDYGPGLWAVEANVARKSEEEKRRPELLVFELIRNCAENGQSSSKHAN